jgi:hypothetical protein
MQDIRRNMLELRLPWAHIHAIRVEIPGLADLDWIDEWPLRFLALDKIFPGNSKPSLE